MRFSDVLLEHNIINLPDLEHWVNELANRCTSPAGADWVRSKFRKYLINADETSDRVAGLSPNAPDWMAKRFEEGTPLHRFRPNPVVQQKLSHIIDWLNSLAAYATAEHKDPTDDLLAKEAAMTLPKLDKYSVEQAEVATDKWFARLNKASSLVKHDGQGTEVSMKTPVGTWVELLDKEATKYEGAQMGHCVGGGSYTVGPDGSYRIFSLRDSKNIPHVTVSMRKGGALDQVKGKQNAAPVAKYQQAVIDLLNEVKPTVQGKNNDLDRMGVFYNNGSFGGIQDVGQKVAEVDSVSVFKLIEQGSYHESNKVAYYFWRKHVYGVLKIGDCSNYTTRGSDKFRGLAGIEYMGNPTPQVKTAVWKVMAQFLNSLDPIPRPASTVEAVYSTKLGRYGVTRQEISQEIGWLSDGTTVMEYDGQTKMVDLYDDQGQHLLSLSQDEKKSGGFTSDPTFKYQIRTNLVSGVVPPSADKIIQAIRLAGLKGGSSQTLRNLGVWPVGTNVTVSRDKDAWVDGQENFEAFDPEKLGLSPLSDGFWGGERVPGSYESPDNALIYDSQGCDCADVQYMTSKGKYDSMRGLVKFVRNPKGISQNDYLKKVEAAVEADPVKLAAWFNRISFPEPTRPYQREQIKMYHLARKGGQWIAMSQAKAIATEGGYSIQAVHKSITVTDAAGQVVVSAQKGKSTHFGVEILKSTAPTPKERRGALLALDSYLAKSEWKVSYDPKEFCRAILAVDPDTKRLRPFAEVFPVRNIKSYGGDNGWFETYIASMDAAIPNNQWTWPTAGKYSLFEGGKTTTRVYSKDKDISLILVNVDAKMVKADSSNIVGLIPMLTDLIEAENLKIDRDYFSKSLGLTMVDGKLKPLADDSRMEDYVRGRITYEDGKRWQKPAHYDRDYNWELVEDTPLATNPDRTHETTILRVKMGQHGLENASFNKKEAQRGAKAYMGYIMDLVELAVGD